MPIQRTLALVKPDAVRRGQAHQILARAKRAELSTIKQTTIHLTRTQAAAFYAEHAGTPYYERIVESLASGPVHVAILEGNDAIATWRQLLGATDPQKAEPGSIRRDYGIGGADNAGHGSSNEADAHREATIIFGPEISVAP